VAEHLPSKCKAISSNPSTTPTPPPKKKVKKIFSCQTGPKHVVFRHCEQCVSRVTCSNTPVLSTEALWLHQGRCRLTTSTVVQTLAPLNFKTYNAEGLLVQIIILILSNGDRFTSCCNVDRTLRSL
jgi:hypothetical protein